MRKVATYIVFLALLLCTPGAQALKKKEKKKKETNLFFNKYCNGTSCATELYFYPLSTASNDTDCFWTRIEVDLPKYSRWKMDASSLRMRSPGNLSCSTRSISMSSKDVLDLEAPTLDCYNSNGCLCSSLDQKALKGINFQPAVKVLGHLQERTACRTSRTYLYLQLNCKLTPPPDNATYENYDYDYDDGYEPPVSVFLNWTREVNTTVNGKKDDIKTYCKSQTNRSWAGYNRWLLTLLVGLSAVVMLGSCAAMLVVSVLQRLVGGKGGKSGKAAAQEGKEAAPSLMTLVLHVDQHNGRSRMFTAVLVAAVGLYIAGILFEPRIKAQNAYERNISPSLRGAIMDLTGYIQINNYLSFVKQLARLVLTIMLCSGWGAVTFCALLFNLSAQPPLEVARGHQRTQLVFRLKLVISSLAMVTLDVGVLFYLAGSWDMRSRWNQPAAYNFLLCCTTLLLAIAHGLFIVLVLQPPDSPATPTFRSLNQKVDVEAVIREQLEESKRQQERLQKKSSEPTGDANDNMSGTKLAPQAASAVGDTTTNTDVTGSSESSDSSSSSSSPKGSKGIKSVQGTGAGAGAGAGEDKKVPLPEKFKLLVEWVKARLREEDTHFHYSPWFIAPMIISLVLLIFFFIRELYIIDDIQACMGAERCPKWTGLNSAVVPVISAAFHAIVTSNSPAEFINQLNRAVIDTPARDLLMAMRSSFNMKELEDRVVGVNIQGAMEKTNGIPTLLTLENNDTLKYTEGSDYISFRVYDHSTDSYIQPVNLTSRPSTPLGTEGYSAYVNTTDYMVYVNDTSWVDLWQVSSREFQTLVAEVLTCNATEIANYISTMAQQSYEEYYNPAQLDQVASYLGMTGVEFAQQLIIAMVKPTLVAECNTTEVLPSTTPVNQMVTSVLESVVSGGKAAAGEANRTLTAKALEQRKRLAKLSKKTRSFYHSLQAAFGPGFYIGACIALAVALASMVVILAVYKRAVIRLRKQVAFLHIVKTHPDGELLLQGTRFGQKNIIQEAFGLEDDEGAGSTDPTSRMFAMLELLKGTRLPMVIFFYGVVFSTVLLQLVVCTILFGLVLTLVFHPMFWTHAFPHLASIIVALVFSQLLVLVVISGTIGSRIAPGDKISTMSAWLAYFIVFSFAYIILGVLLAVVRLIFIFLSALVMSCRIDICLNHIHRVLDPAYNGFMAMMKMQVEMKSHADMQQGERVFDDAPWRTQVTVDAGEEKSDVLKSDVAKK